MRELEAIRTMPLAADLVGQELAIHMLQSCSLVSLQIERTSLEAMRATALRGAGLPWDPNTTAGCDPVIWWRGPAHWLATSETLQAAELITELNAATEGHLCAIVDISDAVAMFRLFGNVAPALLARGTGLVVDRGAFGPGRRARTRLANLAVFLRPLEESGYELLVDRSEAQFLLEWLRDCSAGLEAGRPDVRGDDTIFQYGVERGRALAHSQATARPDFGTQKR